MKKTDNGITLIALVITIIVMLILVAVTITIAVNGGLFEYAQKAVRDTNTAIKGEQKFAELGSDLTVDDLIEKYTTEPDIHSWTRTGDTFTCSHCNASYTMGEQVVYTPNTETASVTVLGTDSGKTDRPVDQTISRPNDLSTLTWIVLGLDKNGTLLITTATPTESLYLHGAEGYLNGPSILNTVCEKLYSSPIYGKARSINIDDVNSCFNLTPAGGMYYSTSQGKNVVTNGFNTKIEDVKDDLNFDITDTSKNKTPESNKSLGDYKINGYFYNFSDTDINMAETKVGTATALEKNVILRGNYWLASTGVSVESDAANFGDGLVRAGYGVSVYSYYYMSKSDGSKGGYPFCLRPVVPLKSELPTKSNP